MLKFTSPGNDKLSSGQFDTFFINVSVFVNASTYSTWSFTQNHLRGHPQKAFAGGLQIDEYLVLE